MILTIFAIDLDDYGYKVASGMEFLVAFFSILGLFLLAIGILGLFTLSKRQKGRALKVLIMGGLLVFIFGLGTGIHYFRLYY